MEVLADDDVPIRTDARVLLWPTSIDEHSDTVVTDIDWTLSSFGDVHPVARDLARIAGAAYLTDRTVPRSTTFFSRRLHLVVHVDQPDVFLSPAGQRLVDLLAWITGDAWTITPVPNTSTATPVRADVVPRAAVQLTSGGLDSLCAALIGLPSHAERLHLGHRDQTRAVAKSQSDMAAALQRVEPSFAWSRVKFAPRKSEESSTRTRSWLFMALAVAAATGSNAGEVIVPENGFTSLNPPLVPSRGGALSTKSTHPWTFTQGNLLMDELGVGVRLMNPHALDTKGQMLARAAATGIPGFDDMVRNSTSCGKMDGGRYKGGNPNLNCGLCIACLVRRGAFFGADRLDPTEYVIDRLARNARAELLERRRSDVWAIEAWATRETTVEDLMASAPWPRGTDYETMVDMVRRGRTELLGALSIAL
ncbi:hypothetical protein [Occultella kanbiaonis]|uniref:hypothetical protein n=1 Tax=Occultella kanbiaonis TaxID=2675754 RepID=UPI0012B70DC3|nr:hypothetical protein [Occultella kanbiaonis]